MSRSIEIHYHPDGDWAAVYVDGKLDHIGDRHNCEERVFVLAGVVVVDDDAFLLGQNQRDGAAQTLADVDEYRSRREADQGRAAALRRRAAELVAEADTLAKTHNR